MTKAQAKAPKVAKEEVATEVKKTNKELLQELGFKSELSRNEKYVVRYCRDRNITIKKVKQYVSKTYYYLEFNGLQDKFELPSTVTNIEKYSSWIEMKFEQLAEIRKYNEMLTKSQGVEYYVEITGIDIHNEQVYIDTKPIDNGQLIVKHFDEIVILYLNSAFCKLYNLLNITIKKIKENDDIDTIDEYEINYKEMRGE